MLTFPEGDAVLDYERSGHTVIFTHTFVPPELRGRGAAEQLVKAALVWAGEHKLHVEATCSYVVRYLERHPRH